MIEAYNSAQVELDKIVAEQKLNEKRLKIARSNLGSAQGTLEARLVQLYQNGSPDLVEVLLGSSSLDEILDGIDTAARVSDQDAQILSEVQKFRAEVKQREAELEKARDHQEQVVAERAARRQQIESTLAQRAAAARLDQGSDRAAQRRGAPPPGAPRGGRAGSAELDVDQRHPGADGRLRPRSTAASSASPCSTSAPRTCGAARRRVASTAPASSMYVFSRVGVSLPRVVSGQYAAGVAVARSEMQPGDLVFFNSLGHVGIYIGGNQFIHSPHTGDVVRSTRSPVTTRRDSSAPGGSSRPPAPRTHRRGVC